MPTDPTTEKLKKLSIKDFAEEDRPREKLLAKGKEALTNAELIAILISSGNREETAVALAQRILNSVKNNLNELGKLSVNQLVKDYNGIGEAKAISIIAAMELGRRRSLSAALSRPVITCSRLAFNYLNPILSDLKQEEFWVLFLNTAAKVISQKRISQGLINSTLVDARPIVKKALEDDAVSVILAHNHPSGNLLPSDADKERTYEIKKALDLFKINLFDHIIVGDANYFSFKDNELLPS